MAGLRDEPRSGAPRTIDDASIDAVIVRTLESCPENATHWSPRDMAKTSGLSVSTSSVSGGPSGSTALDGDVTDPNFVAKVRDVVGLYVSPREYAIVLCVDGNSQTQTLGPQPADAADACRPGGPKEP
ncbi:hypothetical protein [Bradyrhizobium arachidis]|uniref:hypothetical protein n=1 Tax=Bradyrhizobium arachidis TaxID=858423 RepID=UPI0038D0D7A4